MVRQGIAGAVEADILGQGDGQLRHRHRLPAAGGAVDDGDRTAPIALTRDTPVAQAVLDPAFAVPLGGPAVAPRPLGLGHPQAIEEVGLDERAVAPPPTPE